MNKSSLEQHMSPAGALAFSVGTSIGWGSLVVTCNTYLVKAGPLGSILGLLCGAAVMLIISCNYARLIQAFPEAGGAYSYSRDVFGFDYGFLTAWFLAMTYMAILWANATSLPLFARIFAGDLFRKGRLYSLFDYDIYLGEALLSVSAILLTGLLCMKLKRVVNALMITLFAVFTIGIALCFLSAAFKSSLSIQPYFTDDTSALAQVAGIAVISPWAFIGFENISHASEELTFERRKIRRILFASVLITLLLYSMVILLSVTAYPERYGSWFEYILDLDRCVGLEALPPFYAAHAFMGDAGVKLLMLALLALVVTSFIGNTWALSRLFYSMARDHVLPVRFAKLNQSRIPSHAVLLVVLISLPIPFTGRTAIGWIVDVTTIGAILIYGVVSAAAMKVSSEAADRKGRLAGMAGVAVMVFFGIYLLIPNLISETTMAKETFLLFIVWCVLSFIFFRLVIAKDREHRFGSSVIVWVALLSLMLLISFVWMRQAMLSMDMKMKTEVRNVYETGGTEDTDPAEVKLIEAQLDLQEEETTRIMLIAMGMFGFVLLIMLTNHNYMRRRSLESERQANTDAMTGLKNKHAFITREKELDDYIKDGTARDFAVVVCDVNGLKKINDTLGHKAGDEHIINAGRMISEIFQHSPVYRIGGDEFAAVLTGRDYTMRSELMRLLHDHSVKHMKDGGVVTAGGLSDFISGEDEDFRTVFTRADELMYEEKLLLKSLDTAPEISPDAAGSAEAPEMMNSLTEEKTIIDVQRSILIVDDILNREALGNILRKDYRILTAEDGIEALEQIRKNDGSLALIITELNMPRMNGVEFIGRLKEDPDLRNIPFIVIASNQEAELECLQLGAVDFIPKPYPAPEIIRARANKCIELSEGRDIIQSTERDSLTGLFNIEYFIRYVRLFDRHYQDMSMDAMVADINRFHMINERYGKEYGDEILRRMGENVRELVRELKGVGCRQGADTFLLYIPHTEDCGSVFERLSKGLEPNSGNGDTGASIRLRLGVYSHADRNIDIERRFDRAKMAADNIRRDYSTSIGQYDSSMHEDILFKERLLEEFRASLSDRQFTVFFQPKFDIRPDTPILKSAEALVRWEHPELGFINPGVFIPLLEEHGLIFDLDYYVWEETVAFIRRCKDSLGFSVPVSVNVSRIDMLRIDLKEVFDRLLEKYALTPSDILLEITESAYTGDSDQVITMVNLFRNAGFGIEMDDFGTGYSSLGMLSKLPIDALKMDMSFVHTAFGENRDMRMIELIIDIAEHLKVPVIAEGVETEEQYLTLKEMGCDIIQGYYFSKPVTAERFSEFVAERSRIK